MLVGFDSSIDGSFKVGDFVDGVCLIWCGFPYLWPCAQIPYGGFASVKVMSGRASPFTNALAVTSY